MSRFWGRMRRYLLVIASAAIVVLFGRASSAAEHRVTLLEEDVVLRRALDLALSAWGIEIRGLVTTGPGATMPTAVERARSIATEQRADVVIWVSLSDSGYALWIYDADSDHAGARALDRGPPFDSVTAAAIALAVKTILRGSVVAPPTERIGATGTTYPDQRGEGAWRLHLGVGSLVRMGVSQPVEPRASAEASYWPSPFGHSLGASLSVTGGPGIRVYGAEFVGSLLDIGLQLALAGRLRLSRIVALEGAVGAGAHVVSLDGLVVPDATHASIQRINFAVEPRLGMDLGLFGGRLQIGPTIGLLWFPRPERFLVHGAQVLSLPPFAAEGALRLTVALE